MTDDHVLEWLRVELPGSGADGAGVRDRVRPHVWSARLLAR
jgi:hypothetical protein